MKRYVKNRPTRRIKKRRKNTSSRRSFSRGKRMRASPGKCGYRL